MSHVPPPLPSTQEVITATRDIVDTLRDTPGGLIPALQRVQARFGYLPDAALETVSRELKIPYSEVAGVVSFYSYFTRVPRGAHTVRVCLGTACYVRGGKEVLSAITKELGIEVGNTTEDRIFTLEIGRCFGACGLAPVVMVDDTVHQRVGAACVREIIEGYREVVAAGVPDGDGEQASAGTGVAGHKGDEINGTTGEAMR
ncbi:MAG: NAD(P)H-dependent oxidoreductase subunit E [Alkalispirochaeta sp.]